MPVFNEAKFIADTLTTIFQQDYPADCFEVIVADGMSTDQTREILESFRILHPNLRVIDNPQRIVSTGLNRALECARGEIVIRFDGHCVYPKDFVKSVVRILEQTGADNAGGVLVPVGKSYISKAIASAYYSPLGIGGAQRGHREPGRIREVDTVHGGCWRRDRLIAIGKFDEEMVRNQDDELSFRLRKSGGRIVQSSAIRVSYWVRDSFSKLFMQFAQYGYWKVKVVKKHPRQASLRHFIPSLFLLSVLLTTILVAVARWPFWTLGILLGVYASIIALEAFRQSIRTDWKLWPGVVLSLMVMQVAYGWGFIVGLTRRVFGPLPTDVLFERVTR
jgi:glycosyltransferase involved in cell wall biosynthesis